MKKPDKFGVENIPAFFRRLFSSRKTRYDDHLRQNPRWTAKPASATATRERPLVETQPRVQNPAPRIVTITSPQNRPAPREHPSIEQHNPAPSIVTITTPPQSQPAAPKNLASTPVSRPPVRPTPQANLVHTAPTSQLQAISLPAAKPAPKRKPFFEFSKTLPAFWTIASVLSLLVNVILIIALVVLGRQFFALKTIVGDKLLGGLYENFIFMDQAHIRTNIDVAINIPISFTLPISQDTTVVLSQNTAIYGANVHLTTGGVAIDSPANIVLPAGTILPIHLELSVPVNTTVPVQINVPVDIPLENTDLHKPFIGLQQVVAPFYNLLQPQVKGPQDIPLCQPFSIFCSLYFQP